MQNISSLRLFSLMAVAIALLLAMGGASFAAGKPVPTARVYNDSNQSIGNLLTQQCLHFNSEDYDIGDVHNPNTNNGCLLRAPKDGVYAISATISWAINAVGFRFAAIDIYDCNTFGFVERLASTLVNPVAGNSTIQNVVTQTKLFTDECVEVIVFQNSGDAVNVLSGNDVTHFEMTWIASGGG
jgi:hypothetical protein